MSDYSWWPGLIVLAAGLLGGLLMAARLRRGGKNVERRHDERDVALRIQDLEGRRDDLYRRLRDEGDSLTESDRTQLERAAAKVLRDLETVSGGRRKAGRKGEVKARPADAEASRRVPAVPAAGTRRPLLTGFVLGVGMVGVLALLVYWAVRDTAGGSTAVTAGQQVVHPETALPTQEAQQEYDALRSQLERDPDDVMARKRLALLLVANDQFVPAFEEARALLERDPQDIDGLYVEAVVRIQMGQREPALELLDQVLELYPDHVQALAWRGIVFYRDGDINGAVTSWERGIEAAGGRHPELEQMVSAALEEEAGVVEPVEPVPAESPVPAASSRVAAGTVSDGFGLILELAPGVEAPPGVLFVGLRPVSGGAPAAVRRIADPAFPLELTLTSDDSMMGGALPERGVLFVRLDQDGDVSATSSGDLAAEAEVEQGTVTTLRLVRQ